MGAGMGSILFSTLSLVPRGMPTIGQFPMMLLLLKTAPRCLQKDIWTPCCISTKYPSPIIIKESQSQKLLKGKGKSFPLKVFTRSKIHRKSSLLIMLHHPQLVLSLHISISLERRHIKTFIYLLLRSTYY